MVKWTKAHTTKAQKAKMVAKQKQVALHNDVADMPPERGAEGDGAFFTEIVARDAGHPHALRKSFIDTTVSPRGRPLQDARTCRLARDVVYISMTG